MRIQIFENIRKQTVYKFLDTFIIKGSVFVYVTLNTKKNI